MPSSSDPTEQLRAHFRRERNTMDRHPSPEQIAAYHEQRLSPDAMEEMRAHLVTCPDCTAQLLDLAALFEAEEDPGAEISPVEMDAAWQRQQARLSPVPPVVRLEERRASAPLRRPWATAALGLAAALLAVIALAQWRTIAQLRQPQANPPLVNLTPSGSLRQGVERIPELRVPAEARRVWVILNPTVELDAASYDVEVVAPDGQVVLRLENLQGSEAANFRLEIPSDILRAGNHRILLTRGNAEDREVVEEFDLSVHLASPSTP